MADATELERLRDENEALRARLGRLERAAGLAVADLGVAIRRDLGVADGPVGRAERALRSAL